MKPLTVVQKAKIRSTLVDPIKFVLHWLGSDLWSVQKAICKALLKPQAKVNVKACHSSGKTFLAAQITLWWLARYESAIVVTTAPTKKQVEVLMWGEIHKALVKSKYPFPSANLTKLEFDKTKYPMRYALGFTTTVQQQDEGVKFQGFHADHVLIIIDEAPGVDPKIIEAIEGIRAGGDVRILKLGNPTISSGAFYDEFHNQRASIQPFTISAFDTPNFEGIKLSYEAQDSEGAPITVTLGDPNGRDLMDLTEEELDQNVMPWLTTRRWVKERFEEWGPGDFRWDSRVMGDFPSQSPDALLSLAWLERAQRDTRTYEGKVDIGIDVAGPGEDETVMVARCGFQILEIISWGNPDPRGELVSALRKYGDRIRTLNVDSAGIGYYLHKHLQDLGFPSNAVNVGESPADKEQFVNLKAELYWGLRMRAKSGDLSGLTDETTISQLASIRWKPNNRGQTEIESKEAMRKRGVKSPDRAEAIMLAFAKVAKNGAGLLEYYQGITAVQTGGDQDSNPKTPGFRPAPTVPTPVKAPAMTAYNRAMAALAPQDLCDHCGKPLGDTVVEEGIRRMHPDCARPSWAQ
jgi:hypothetical protein